MEHNRALMMLICTNFNFNRKILKYGNHSMRKEKLKKIFFVELKLSA